MPRLATPADSADSERVSVRCLRLFRAKMPGDDRRPSMNLGLSLLVIARTQVLPTRARTKLNLHLSAAQSRPWSLERQSQEGCRGPSPFDPRPFMLLSYPFLSPHSLPNPSCFCLVFVQINDPSKSYLLSIFFRPVLVYTFPLAFSLSSYSLSIPYSTIHTPAIRRFIYVDCVFICYYLSLSSITASNSNHLFFSPA